MNEVFEIDELFLVRSIYSPDIYYYRHIGRSKNGDFVIENLNMAMQAYIVDQAWMRANTPNMTRHLTWDDIPAPYRPR